MVHPVMVETAGALAEKNIATFRFNYPYSEQGKAAEWQDSLDALAVLLATARTAMTVATEAASDLPLFVGGRSMSSQVVSLAMAEDVPPSVRGVVLFDFLIRWRKLLNDPVAHLKEVPVPMLFVQGDRDHLAELKELRRVLDRLDNRATLIAVDGADHFFNPPAGSSRTRKEMLAKAALLIENWISLRL